MAIKMDPETYDKAYDTLTNTEPIMNQIINDINIVNNNVEPLISLYVCKDLHDITVNIDNVNFSIHETSDQIASAAEDFRKVENRASAGLKAIGTLEGALLGSVLGPIGAGIGALIGDKVSDSIVDDSEIKDSTASVVTKATSAVANLFESAKNTIGKVVNDVGDAISNTAAKATTKAKSAFNWITGKAQEVGKSAWNAVTHPIETLKKTGASIANTAVALVQGVGEFGEALVDTASIVGQAAATPIYGIVDGIQWLGGKISGNEDWQSVTKKAWQGTMDFVSTKYVTDAFDSFHQNNVVGQWLDENSYEPFKSTGAAYKIADGVGYIGGIILLTLATCGIGGAAAGAGAAGTGAATTAGTSAGVLATLNVGNVATVNITQQAITSGVIAATAGFGKNTQNAWADGATLSDGLTYGTAMGLWEGAEMFLGAEINALKFPGLAGFKGQLITTGSHVALDTVDGGSGALINPLMQMLYNPTENNLDQIMYLVNYDENGVKVNDKTWDELSFTEKYQALFEYNGGWGAVGTQALSAGAISFLTEVPELRKALTATQQVADPFATDGTLSFKSASDSVDATTMQLIEDLDKEVKFHFGGTKGFSDITIGTYEYNVAHYGKLIADKIKALGDVSARSVVSGTTAATAKQATTSIGVADTSAIMVSGETAGIATKQIADVIDDSANAVPKQVAAGTVDTSDEILGQFEYAAKELDKSAAMAKELADLQDSYTKQLNSIDPSDTLAAQKNMDLKRQHQLQVDLLENIHKKGMTLDEYINSLKQADEIDPNLRAAIQQKAQEIGAKAVQIEPAVTSLMESLQDDSAHLIGLNAKFKSQGSIESKLYRLVNNLHCDLTFAEDQVNDSLRYTLICDSGNYEDIVLSKIAKIKQNGYQIRYMNNAWGSNKSYSGLNVTFTSPEGIDLEVQFHTQASFDVKEFRNHSWYELYRNPNVDPQIKGLSEKIMVLNQSIYNTDNVTFAYHSKTDLNNAVDNYIKQVSQPPKPKKLIAGINAPEVHAYEAQIDSYPQGYIKYKKTGLPADAVIDSEAALRQYGKKADEILKNIASKYGENSIQFVTARGTLAQYYLKTLPFTDTAVSMTSSSGIKAITDRINDFYSKLGIKARDATQDVISAHPDFCPGSGSWENANRVCKETVFKNSYNAWTGADPIARDGMKLFTGNDYTALNNALRTGDFSHIKQEYIDQISALYKYLSESAPDLNETTLMYRGIDDISWLAAGTVSDALKDANGVQLTGKKLSDAINALGGGVYEIGDNGFASSTPVLGQGFTRFSPIIEVTSCPPGTKGAYVGDISSHHSEVEWLLNAGEGNKKIILGSEYIGGKVYVYTQMVPSP